MSNSPDNPELNIIFTDSSTKNTEQPPKNLSPCIRNCCLNESDICLGCFRSLTEIIGWQNRSQAEQKDILDTSAERKKSLTR